METLNYKVLSETGYNGYILKDAPVKVMQFGEGNFLRAFVVPNLSPREQREKYALYDNKAAFGAEAAEGLRNLAQRLETIGYRISTDRGDYNH